MTLWPWVRVQDLAVIIPARRSDKMPNSPPITSEIAASISSGRCSRKRISIVEVGAAVVRLGIIELSRVCAPCLLTAAPIIKRRSMRWARLRRALVRVLQRDLEVVQQVGIHELQLLHGFRGHSPLDHRVRRQDSARSHRRWCKSGARG